MSILDSDATSEVTREKLLNSDIEWNLCVRLRQLDGVYFDRVFFPDNQAYGCFGYELHRRRPRRRVHTLPRVVLLPGLRWRALV